MSINAFSIERSDGSVTASDSPLVRFNDVLPFTVALTDSAVANTTALGNAALGVVLRITNAAGAVLAQCTEYTLAAGVATGRLVLGDTAEEMLFKAANGNVLLEFTISEKTGPRITYTLETTISTAGGGAGTGDVLSSAPVFAGALVTTANPMGALEIDVTKSLNTITITGAVTLSLSATPAASDTRSILRLYNNSATASVVTLPGSPAWFSENLQAVISTITVPAGFRGEISWCYDGTRLLIKADPVTAAQLLNVIGLVPLRSFSADTSVALTDVGCGLLHPSADTTARTVTFPANASVAIAIGACVTIVNQNAGGVVTIATTSDTMRLAGAGTTGNRSLAANGIATALKITATEWIISGTGLT